jgi:hypothetical protein
MMLDMLNLKKSKKKNLFLLLVVIKFVSVYGGTVAKERIRKSANA